MLKQAGYVANQDFSSKAQNYWLLSHYPTDSPSETDNYYPSETGYPLDNSHQTDNTTLII